MKRTLLTVSLTSAITAGTVGILSHQNETPVEAKAPTPVVLHHETIIESLTKSSELVSLTGKAKKTVDYTDSSWLGDSRITLTTQGKFRMGIDTSKIEVTTHGNVVKVRLPEPELIALEMPYHKMDVEKDSGLFRKDLPEETAQALYKKAEKQLRKDIANDRQAHEKAEDNAEKVVRGMLLKINGVEAITFEH